MLTDGTAVGVISYLKPHLQLLQSAKKHDAVMHIGKSWKYYG